MTSPTFPHPISVAPMMRRTDRHFRFLMRQISNRTLLYTEMITSGAIVHGHRERLLGFAPCEHPIALQVGGSDPDELALAAKIAEDFGYDEINLNVGCPSNRVQTGRFGACLMKTPELVATCVDKMIEAVDIEVTVKHRIGVDDIDSYEDMLRFVDTVSAAGCRRFTVHARKAWLKGLSPSENRNIPPLRHHEVHQLKRARPHLVIETNGGVCSLDECQQHLEVVDAVMIGRAAYDNPFLFADVDRRFYGCQAKPITRHDVVRSLVPHVDRWVAQGRGNLAQLTRHYLNLFKGQRGGRAWRRHLSENAWRDGATSQVLLDALRLVPEDISESYRASSGHG